MRGGESGVTIVREEGPTKGGERGEERQEQEVLELEERGGKALEGVQRRGEAVDSQSSKNRTLESSYAPFSVHAVGPGDLLCCCHQ